MAISDPLVMPLARELLACLDGAMADVASPPAHVELRPGTQVDHLLALTRDECCEGLAWVRTETFFPTTTFPEQMAAPQTQGVFAWAVTLEMGAIRCAPVGDEDVLPTGDEWDACVQAVMDDAAAMRRAICCFIDAQHGRARKVIPGAWNPLPVQGGCAGGTLPVTILGPACDC